MSDLTNATPAEIDSQLAELDREALALEKRVEAAVLSLRSALGQKARTWGRGASKVTEWPTSEADAIAEMRAKGTEYIGMGRTADSVVKRYDEAAAALAANLDQQAPLEAEWARRPWTRFYVVQGGHIHKSRYCSTCNRGQYRTSFGWMPDMSGMDETEALTMLAQRAHVLCTVCFPNAPVVAPAEVAPTHCLGSGRPVVKGTIRGGMSRYGDCSECTDRPLVVGGGVARKHKAKDPRNPVGEAAPVAEAPAPAAEGAEVYASAGAQLDAALAKHTAETEAARPALPAPSPVDAADAAALAATLAGAELAAPREIQLATGTMRDPGKAIELTAGELNALVAGATPAAGPVHAVIVHPGNRQAIVAGPWETPAEAAAWWNFPNNRWTANGCLAVLVPAGDDQGAAEAPADDMEAALAATEAEQLDDAAAYAAATEAPGAGVEETAACRYDGAPIFRNRWTINADAHRGNGGEGWRDDRFDETGRCTAGEAAGPGTPIQHMPADDQGDAGDQPGPDGAEAEAAERIRATRRSLVAVGQVVRELGDDQVAELADLLEQATPAAQRAGQLHPFLAARVVSDPRCECWRTFIGAQCHAHPGFRNYGAAIMAIAAEIAAEAADPQGYLAAQLGAMDDAAAAAAPAGVQLGDGPARDVQVFLADLGALPVELAGLMERAQREATAGLVFDVEAGLADLRRRAAEAAGVAHCRVCGCTEDRACPGGCAWAGDAELRAAGLEPMDGDVCTACVPGAGGVQLGAGELAEVLAIAEAAGSVTIGDPAGLLALVRDYGAAAGRAAVRRLSREAETVWCEAHPGAHFELDDCQHPHFTDAQTRAAMNASDAGEAAAVLEQIARALGLGDAGAAAVVPRQAGGEDAPPAC
jgi:hypothetical protein